MFRKKEKSVEELEKSLEAFKIIGNSIPEEDKKIVESITGRNKNDETFMKEAISHAVIAYVALSDSNQLAKNHNFEFVIAVIASAVCANASSKEIKDKLNKKETNKKKKQTTVKKTTKKTAKTVKKGSK